VFAAGCAGFGAPVFGGAALPLGAGFVGFGAAAELFALDPPEGELAGFAAGLGALELPEPLEELAGFGATCGALSPPPPPGPPATLAAVRTAAEDGDSAAGLRAVCVVVFAGESSVPIIHTSAAPPNSTDTEPARHTRDSPASSTPASRTGRARDVVGAETGSTARMRRPPIEVTETITSSPQVQGAETVTASRLRAGARWPKGRLGRTDNTVTRWAFYDVSGALRRPDPNGSPTAVRLTRRPARARSTQVYRFARPPITGERRLRLAAVRPTGNKFRDLRLRTRHHP
jgi:hypothetical protein